MGLVRANGRSYDGAISVLSPAAISSGSNTKKIFFVKNKLFSILSFLLTDNYRSGRVRAWVLRKFGANVAPGCYLRGGLKLQESFNLTIGPDVFINHGCTLDCSAPLEIGSRAELAFNVTIITGGHEIGGPNRRAGDDRCESVKIGAGAWIGACATILPGVTIGEGAIVGAGALVTKDVEANTLVVGVPAKPVRELPGPA